MSINKEGITGILDKLTDSDVLALANTVTQGLTRNLKNTREGFLNFSVSYTKYNIYVNSYNSIYYYFFLDAYICIVKYSTDNLSFLKRKIITRDVLFSYLNERNITIQYPFTKTELIQKILIYWNCDETGSNNNGYSDDIIQADLIKKEDKENKDALPNVNELATKFAEWFYTLLNSNKPIEEEHFWPDCKLKMKLPTNIIEISDSVSDIVNALFKTRNENNLFFNPNLTSDGTRGKINIYGLVLVLSCGTLHVNNQIVGVYEQVFSLARDPLADNNWKIKNMEINLNSKDYVTRQPNLEENELTGNLLSLQDY